MENANPILSYLALRKTAGWKNRFHPEIPFRKGPFQRRSFIIEITSLASAYDFDHLINSGETIPISVTISVPEGNSPTCHVFME